MRRISEYMDGVYQMDLTDTVSTFNSGLGVSSIEALCVNDEDCYLFAANDGGGIWRTTTDILTQTNNIWQLYN